MQDKDSEEREANRDQVFGGFVPGSFHLGFILPALKMAVVKPKYEKSVIHDIHDPDAGEEMALL
jgi:hypothetical protein